MKIAVLLAPALMIGASAGAQVQPPQPYTALGTEPFWSLSIDSRSIRFEDAERRRLIVPAPVPRPSFNGMRYVTPAITVDVTRSRCSDGMSDRTYPDSVTVLIGRRTLRGCGGVPIGGGGPTPVSALDGRWRVASINGHPVVGPRAPSLLFEGDRVSGNSGCNSFGASYRFERGFLTTTRLIATQMGCQQPAMAQERALFDALHERLSVTRNAAGKLVLNGRTAVRLVLVR